MAAIDVASYLNVAGSPVHMLERRPDGQASELGQKLSALCPWLRVFTARCEGPQCPRTRIEGTRAHGEITWLGPIEGRLVEALVVALRGLSTGELDFDTPATPSRLAELTHPVPLSLSVSKSCPVCPGMMAICLRLAAASPHVSLVIARADLGFGAGVASVPTLRANGQVVLEGARPEYAVVELVSEAVA